MFRWLPEARNPGEYGGNLRVTRLRAKTDYTSLVGGGSLALVLHIRQAHNIGVCIENLEQSF